VNIVTRTAAVRDGAVTLVETKCQDVDSKSNRLSK